MSAVAVEWNFRCRSEVDPRKPWEWQCRSIDGAVASRSTSRFRSLREAVADAVAHGFSGEGG